VLRLGHALYGHRSTAQFKGRVKREGIGRDDAKAALRDSFYRLGRPWTRFPAVVLAAVLEPYLATALVPIQLAMRRVSACGFWGWTHLNCLFVRHGDATQELETRCLVRLRVFIVGLLQDRLVFGPTTEARQHRGPIGSAG